MGAAVQSLREARGDGRHKAELLLRGMPARGLTPDVISFNALLSACERAGNGADALGWLREMGELGAPPDLVSYNTAISACGRAGMWRQALELLSEVG